MTGAADMTGEIERVREEARVRGRLDAYRYFVAILTVLAAAGVSIGISVFLTHRSEQKLCAVVITSDDTYRTTPPTTPVGKVQAANFSRLRLELGCEPYKGAS